MECIATHLVIEHIAKHARKWVGKSALQLLILDGQSIHSGYRWVRNADSKTVHVVQAPSNTSKTFQPNEASVDQAFQRAVLTSRGQIDYNARMVFGDVSLKLKLGV